MITFCFILNYVNYDSYNPGCFIIKYVFRTRNSDDVKKSIVDSFFKKTIVQTADIR